MEPTQIAGLATGGLNFIQSGIQGMQNYMLGLEDRKYQRELNEQAQKNFETQMEFAKAQAAQQVKQFEANRIGNLTKEYAEAGLNPLLAAGMGQSTASSVGMGGLPHQSGTDASTSNMIAANKAMQEQSGLMTMASINKTNAEANLLEAETEKAKEEARAIREEKKDAIITSIELSEKQIDEINARINAIEKQAKNQELMNKLLEPQVMEAKLMSNVEKMMQENLTEKQYKRYMKWHRKSFEAKLKQAKANYDFTNSMTVKNYTGAVCDIAQTCINAATGNAGNLVSSRSVNDLTAQLIAGGL